MGDSLTFSVAEAQLTALLLEAIGYGILLVTFGICLHTLFTRRGSSQGSPNINSLMVAVASIAFFLSSFNIALAITSNLRAFIYYRGEGGPSEAFSMAPHWITFTKVGHPVL